MDDAGGRTSPGAMASAVNFENVFSGATDTVGDPRVPVYRRIRSSIHDGRHADAVLLIDQFAERARYAFDLINRWCASIHRFLADHGLSAADRDGIEADLLLLANHPANVPFDKEGEWSRLLELKAQLVREIGRAPVEVALATAETFKECWRAIHDRNNDHVSGLFNVVHIRFGERTIESVYRDYVIEDFVEAKYGQFGKSPEAFNAGFDKLVAWTFSGIQLHMSGPERDGSIEFVEHEDRVEFIFDPCGNGARMMRGEPLDGTPSRLTTPYHYRVIEGAYDFTWNKSGVCHYCAHCNLIQHKMPIEKYGFPMRVVDPPTYPDRTGAKCKWTIYRRVDLVPEKAFTDVGERKPDVAPPGA